MDAPDTFESMIDKERTRLGKRREDALARRQKLDEELDQIQRELYAIDAYEQAKKHGPGSTTKTRAPRQSGTRGKRDTVLTAVKDNPGIARGELLEQMGFKGDKQGEMFVSNALSALKKQGQLRLDDGKYYPA